MTSRILNWATVPPRLVSVKISPADPVASQLYAAAATVVATKGLFFTMLLSYVQYMSLPDDLYRPGSSISRRKREERESYFINEMERYCRNNTTEDDLHDGSFALMNTVLDDPNLHAIPVLYQVCYSTIPYFHKLTFVTPVAPLKASL